TCRNILSVAVDPQDPNVRYAGSGCGLFKTAGGRTGQWTQIGAQFISASVLAIVIDPTNSDNVYAGTDGGGVFKVQSGGSGITNITTNNGISDPVIRGLAIHSQFSNVIYAATANQGIFKGRTAATGQWLAFNSGLSAMQILAIGASVQGDPRFLYAATADDVYGIEQSSVLPPPADLALSTRPPRQQSKGVFNYSIDVTNRGPNAIEYIKVYIEPARSSAAFGGLLDPPLTGRIRSLSFSGGICRLHSPNLISCARGPLASGASATLAFIVKSSTRTSLFQQPLIPVNVIGSSRIAGDLWGTVDPNLFNNSVKVFLPLP
ncbi:MAG: WD40/YVTN/BNR-like repeat-containing protein, partial [Dongiaceae bacterium]